MIQIYGRELCTYIYLSWRVMVLHGSCTIGNSIEFFHFSSFVLFLRIAEEKIEICRKWKHLLLLHAFIDVHPPYFLSLGRDRATDTSCTLIEFVFFFLLSFLEFTGFAVNCSGLVYAQKYSVDHDVWKTVRRPVRISVWITFKR